MTAIPMTPEREGHSESAATGGIDSPSERIWAVCVSAVLIGISFLAASHESFWIDEAVTTHFASQPSLTAMWQEMLRLRWPELQAPLYMAYIWAWQHLFGSGEWTSRFAGAPWFVLGATIFVTSFTGRRQRISALLAVALNPFTWFYLNEARLYSVQLGITYLLIAILIRLQRAHVEQKPFQLHWVLLLGLSIWLLCALTVLGMIWVSVVFLIFPALFSVRTLWRWAHEHWVLLTSLLATLAPCAAYYLWTRSLGTRATSFGGIGWKNLGFIIYEGLGFNGLGPGRLALREGGLSAIEPWFPLLAIYAIALGLVCVAGIRELIQSRGSRFVLAIALALAVPTSFLVSIGFLMNFRLLGRHCTPMEPVIVLVVALGIATVSQSKRWWARVGLGAFLALTLLSCLFQRFALRHAKDDYRSAARIAKAALKRGESVWWNADPFGCEYYHLNSNRDSPVPGSAWVLMGPAFGFEKGLADPDMLIFSKPDAYDPFGSVQQLIKKKGYVPVQTLPAFVIFQRPGKASVSAASQSP